MGVLYKQTIWKGQGLNKSIRSVSSKEIAIDEFLLSIVMLTHNLPACRFEANAEDIASYSRYMWQLLAQIWDCLELEGEFIWLKEIILNYSR